LHGTVSALSLASVNIGFLLNNYLLKKTFSYLQNNEQTILRNGKVHYLRMLIRSFPAIFGIIPATGMRWVAPPIGF